MFFCFFSFACLLADILGHERIDLPRLKKQAQLTQLQIPKTPRIERTLNTLESVLKILDEHSRISKCKIDQLIQSVEKQNLQLARVKILLIYLNMEKRKTNFIFILFYFIFKSNCMNLKLPI